MLVFTMFLAMFFWGGSWVSAKLLSVTADPVMLTFWRFALISLAALPLTMLDRRLKVTADAARLRIGVDSPIQPGSGPGTTPPNLATWRWTLLAALILTGYNLVFFGGLLYGGSGKAGVIVTTLNPLFAFMLASIFESHRPNKLQIFGLVIGIAGGMLQTLPDLLGNNQELTIYTLMFVGAGFLWAALTLCSSKAQRNTGVFTYTARVYGISTMLLLVVLFISRGVNWMQDTVLTQPNFWLNELYLALPAGVFATGMYFFAARALGSGKGSSFTFLVPLSALLLSWILLGEQPLATTIFGGGLSALAVYIIQRNR